jgi:hypothetical protein
MQTRPFLPSLKALFFGSKKSAPIYGAQQTANRDTKEPKQPSLESHRLRQRISRPHGRHGMRNPVKRDQVLTNPKFMSRSQRVRFAKGETISV